MCLNYITLLELLFEITIFFGCGHIGRAGVGCGSEYDRAGAPNSSLTMMLPATI
jgi:hypothetical protein